MLALALVVVLTGAQPVVVVSAHPSVLPELKAQLEARGKTVVDASAIDHSLFGPSQEDWSLLKLGELDEPLPELPEAVLADVKRGIAGCKQTKEDQCGQRLVQAVWQRYLERTKPEWVFEVREPQPGKKVALFAEAAVYAPQESFVAVVHPRGADVKAVVKMLLDGVLNGKTPVSNATRPNSNVLPGERKLPKPDLALGVPQSLAGMKLNFAPGCKVPVLQLQPKSAPLAVTLSALWTSSLELSKVTPQGLLVCTLSVDASYVTLSCGSFVQQSEIFAGTAFDDAKYQAGLAKQMVLFIAGAACR